MIKKSIWTNAVLVLALALFGAGARAQTGGLVKIDYLSGGVGLDELEELAGRAKKFNLKVVTAAERSGAFLADVRVKVIGAGDAQVLLDTTMDGPWLLAQLPPGKYVLEATFEGKTFTKTIAIPNTGLRDVYFYWRVADLLDVEQAPERPPPSWMTPGVHKH